MEREIAGFGALRGMTVVTAQGSEISENELVALKQQLDSFKLKGHPSKNILVIRVWGALKNAPAVHTIMSLAQADSWTVVLSVRGNVYYPWYREANMVEVILEGCEQWLMFPAHSIVWDVRGKQTTPQLLKDEPVLGLIHQTSQKHVVGIAISAYPEVMEGTQFLWTIN